MVWVRRTGRKRRTVEEARKAEQKDDEPQRKVGLISPEMALIPIRFGSHSEIASDPTTAGASSLQSQGQG